MTKPRNTRSVRDLFAGFDTTIREMVVDKPRAYIEQIRHKLRNLPETNFQLGCDFADQGKWIDAAFRFRFTIYLSPQYAQAHYNLGCCYMQLGKRDKARECFLTTLKLKPEHSDAKFMLSAVAPASLPANQLPKTMPADQVQKFFTQVAGQYDEMMKADGYQGPVLAFDACKPFLKKLDGLHVIDLGSGTGLAARPWRAISREILAVDYTQAMVTASEVARAADHPLYDRVLHADIHDIAPGTFMPGASDVVLCIDTTQFIGELTPLLKVAHAALAEGGLLVLSIEPFATSHGYGVNPDTGRFGHHVDYVKQTAQAGFDIKRDARVTFYTDQPAHLFVLAKKATAA